MSLQRADFWLGSRFLGSRESCPREDLTRTAKSAKAGGWWSVVFGKNCRVLEDAKKKTQAQGADCQLTQVHSEKQVEKIRRGWINHLHSSLPPVLVFSYFSTCGEGGGGLAPSFSLHTLLPPILFKDFSPEIPSFRGRLNPKLIFQRSKNEPS